MMAGGMDMEKQFEAVEKLDEIHGDLKRYVEAAGGAKGVVPAGDLLELIRQVSELQDLVAPEAVTVDSSPAEDGCAAIGWAMTGGLSVGLTRSSTDGKLLVTLENTVNDASNQHALPVRIELMSGGANGPLWEGEVQ
jgi:hypothetical protein